MRLRLYPRVRWVTVEIMLTDFGLVLHLSTPVSLAAVVLIWGDLRAPYGMVDDVWIQFQLSGLWEWVVERRGAGDVLMGRDKECCSTPYNA